MGSEEKYKNIFNNKKEREKFKVSHFECFGKKQLINDLSKTLRIITVSINSILF